MHTIEYSGTIESIYDYWHKIKLVQADGYTIDLVSRFQEIKESYPKAQMQVCYWLSDKPRTKDEMITGFLNKLYGVIDAEYIAEEYHYSSWTYGTNYISALKIGGHDLFNELYDKKGMYIIIEINLKERKNGNARN